jgi:hypothetical protein
VHGNTGGTLICELPYITEEIEFDNRLMFYDAANVVSFNGFDFMKDTKEKEFLRKIKKKQLILPGKVVLISRAWKDGDKVAPRNYKSQSDYMEWRLRPDGKRDFYGRTFLLFGYWDHPDLPRDSKRVSIGADHAAI